VLVDDKEENIDIFMQHSGNFVMIPLRHTGPFDFRASLEASLKMASQRVDRCP
jgi:hypothetical protein